MASVDSATGEDRDLSPEADLDPSVLDVVARSQLVCLVVAIPSKVIVAASPRTQDLFADEGSVIGRNVEEFLTDEPIEGVVERLVEGRVVGYESVRRVRQGDGDVEFHSWVQALGEFPPRYALIVAWEKDWNRLSGTSDAGDHNYPVVGTIDPNLLIERISAEARDLFGCDPQTLIGTPLLSLVAQPDVANVLLVLAQAASSGAGALHRARVQAADEKWTLCSVLVLPLLPLPRAAFALLPWDDFAHVHGTVLTGRAVQQVVERLGREVDGGMISRQLADAPWGTWPELNSLSSRELEIVCRIVAGDRVSMIAESLYISESTVRNHLSGAFEKLGVHSQQELIVLLRDVSERSTHD